uniref:Cytochrome P450 n=1 Tax=Tetradesmus obliquus TaxID=3088 RepID=A0A383WDQ0_TETOB|eukprot:jgi/Sobl393_1/7112/SZX75728.1
MQTGLNNRCAGLRAPQGTLIRGQAAAAVVPCSRPARRVQIVARAADANLHSGNSSQSFDEQHDSSSSSSGKCPFLAALPAPPPAQNAWWRRLQQLFSPADYQKEALGPHSVVAAPAQMMMPPQYVLGTADMVKTAFAGEAEGLTTVAPSGLMSSRSLLGDQSLLMLPEPQHKYLRNLIMPAFTNEAIERLVPRMEAVLQRYLDAWADAGAPVKAHNELRHMTFEFIVAVVLGRDYPEATISRLSGLYTTWAGGLLAWPFIDLPWTPFGKAVAAKQQLLDFFQAAVDEARLQLAAGHAVPGILGSLVSAVDEQGNRLTDAQLGDNLLLIMLAGHDTSSTTLTNVMADLQSNPRVVERLRQEQQAVVAKHGSRITGAILKEMTYADAVIRETLRLHNVVSGLMRQAAKDFELGGYSVPKGTVLYLPVTHVGLQDPRFLEQHPEAYAPERFMTPEGQKPGAQMPFGHGPRFCAGYAVAMAEMKVFLALLARGYDFDADTNTQWRQEIGRVPANGLPMTVSRRPAAVVAGAAPAAAARR